MAAGFLLTSQKSGHFAEGSRMVSRRLSAAVVTKAPFKYPNVYKVSRVVLAPNCTGMGSEWASIQLEQILECCYVTVTGSRWL